MGHLAWVTERHTLYNLFPIILSSPLMAARRQTLNSVYSTLGLFWVMWSGGRADPEWRFLRAKLGSAAVR